MAGDGSGVCVGLFKYTVVAKYMVSIIRTSQQVTLDELTYVISGNSIVAIWDLALAYGQGCSIDRLASFELPVAT